MVSAKKFKRIPRTEPKGGEIVHRKFHPHPGQFARWL
ncbi:GABRA4 isoform 3 [Pan troglodytes]|uniref:Gamma-aminobutyric acid type A receptor subunit alpha4 n=3 Tax=Hominidae TaxID=9604 RepID=D6R924_HUMAN|nr:GABRA4 isoform 2 [Pan troglodytes]PNI41639.1 GABRA4 isoform 3 [Pan troglodytes]PNJ32974.1 GABRA4 isoform 2 [Pongo abelii]PNJ32975.1 GABRA4 isoform 3 [Pongo abelii]